MMLPQSEKASADSTGTALISARRWVGRLLIFPALALAVFAAVHAASVSTDTMAEPLRPPPPVIVSKL